MFVIVDYGVGNLNSIQNMVKKGGNTAVISGDEQVIRNASRLLLPGMGHFDNCMLKLRASGLLSVIEEKVFIEKRPILGICVGLQMLMASSEEGKETGLGWIKGKTVRFNQESMGAAYKIPNMGWLTVIAEKASPMWYNLETPRFYFAHSYHVVPDQQEDILFSAEYGYRFTAGIQHENIYGVQFHPEKSHKYGMQLLKNFAEKI
jgi:glutamine amidotransferase